MSVLRLPGLASSAPSTAPGGSGPPPSSLLPAVTPSASNPSDSHCLALSRYRLCAESHSCHQLLHDTSALPAGPVGAWSLQCPLLGAGFPPQAGPAWPPPQITPPAARSASQKPRVALGLLPSLHPHGQQVPSPPASHTEYLLSAHPLPA